MTKKKLVGIALAAMMAMSMAACGDSDSSATSGGDTKAEVNSDANAAPSEDQGFTEIPIDSIQDEEVGGFLNVSAVYFQAVPMSGRNEDISKFDIHLEADVSALENKVGIPTPPPRRRHVGKEMPGSGRGMNLPLPCS